MGRAWRSSALQLGLDLAAAHELELRRQQAPSSRRLSGRDELVAGFDVERGRRLDQRLQRDLAALPTLRLPQGRRDGLPPNWPISYEDLAPFYEKADRLIGTSGLAGDPAMPPRDPCPTGPLPFTRAAGRLAEAFDKLGWHWWPAEAGVISENYDGRPACNGCGDLQRLPARLDEQVLDLDMAQGPSCGTRAPCARAQDREGPDGRATGVHFVDRNTGRTEFQGAKLVIIAANGVGTPRLLLASDNLANSSDQVGRNLLHHTLVTSEFWVDEPIESHMGYVASLLGREFAETDVSRGFVNGFQFNCLTNTSSAGEAAAGWASNAKAPWGRGHHEWFERHFAHGIGVHAIGDDLPNPNNRVTIDPAVRDSYGLPAAKLFYEPGENDRRMMNFMLDRMEDIAKAAGAFDYKATDYRDENGVYRTPAWHMIGTCRMGADPERSVVNKWNQSWDVPNLFIVDGSVVATGGVVNPTPTISALALRAATYIRDNFRELSVTTRPMAA